MHIFNVNSGKKDLTNAKNKAAKPANNKNNKSILGKLGLGAFFNYFDSELNFAHYKNNYDSQTKAIFLDNEDMVLLISYKGDCCRLKFDHEYGGECTRTAAANLLVQKD